MLLCGMRSDCKGVYTCIDEICRKERAMGRNKVNHLDDIGRKILEELQRNSRVSFRELGKRINLSCSSVIERVKRMEEDGLIQGYAVLLDAEKMGFAVCVIVNIKSNSPEDEKLLAGRLREDPSVLQFWNVTGNNDFVVEALFPDVKKMNRFLVSLGSHGQTFSSVVINKHHLKPIEIEDV